MLKLSDGTLKIVFQFKLVRMSCQILFDVFKKMMLKLIVVGFTNFMK